VSAFAQALVAWQRRHGRHDLPWQASSDPYRIWLSEVMLQQTQVGTVIPYFERFVARFPDVMSLAAADADEVLALWSGLGYYSRARNLHRAAQLMASEHQGRFPRERSALERLPGVGRSTAAAIAALAFGARAAILDGNVKRVLARHFAVAGWPGAPAVASALWRLAESLLPDADVDVYTQALMDLGATVCRTRGPACMACPVATTCAALAQGRVSAYPAPRPRRTVPQRSTYMLALLHDDTVLLEKRPAAGIWGGLWCLPEAASQESALASAARRGTVAAVGALATVAHAFTHYALDIHPVVVRLADRTLLAAEPAEDWTPLAHAGVRGLPAPVKRILAALAAA
jgi:A/G-specific adenine glycosylase